MAVHVARYDKQTANYNGTLAEQSWPEKLHSENKIDTSDAGKTDEQL